MIDTTQILLISAITIMTILLTMIGIQLIFVLRDLRIFLGRINTITEELEKVGMSLGHGYSEVLGFFSGLRNLFSIIDILSKKKHRKDD